VTQIINRSQRQVRRTGDKPISKNTPHSTIRTMMENPNCIACGQPLKWGFGRGKTPPLHHSHKTGAPWGFTHMRCNVEFGTEGYQILREENARLIALVAHLQHKLRRQSGKI
jgi:hypothetical protein